MNERQDRMLGRCILGGTLWLGLHLFVAVQNIGDSLYVTFDGWTFVWLAVYAAALLLLDVLLYFLNSPSAAKSWARYWIFCVVVCALSLLCERCKLQLGLWALFPLAATPLVHFDPLWRMVFPKGSGWGTVCTLLLCGAHVMFFLWLKTRNRETAA